MKAKKIDLRPYKCRDNEIDVVNNLVGILFAPQQRLNSDGLRRMGKIADKIESGENELIVSIDEDKSLKKTIDAFQGVLNMHREQEKSITCNKNSFVHSFSSQIHGCLRRRSKMKFCYPSNQSSVKFLRIWVLISNLSRGRQYLFINSQQLIAPFIIQLIY